MGQIYPNELFLIAYTLSADLALEKYILIQSKVIKMNIFG